MLMCGIALSQETGSWRDPSPHRAQFVRVEDRVQLEVLDWGGTGRPIVLLAGYLTAHAYDDFAPKLSQIGHIYGVTRRGLGASSRPGTGYNAQRSAEDVLQVLNTLNLVKPVLLGHSFGGQDLTTLAVNYPDRIAGIVYLNSAEDPTLTLSDYGVEPVDPKKLPATMRNPPEPDYSSFEAYRFREMRTHGAAFPESELRQIFASNPDGTMGRYLVPESVRAAMFKGVQKPDDARIRVPVLAFLASGPSLEDQIRKYKPQNAEERAAMERQYHFDLAIRRRHMQDLKTGVPRARVVEVPEASFYIFLSNEAELLRELRAFVSELQ